jgi:DNA-binding LacI/PurR family transcriptional regulator
MPKVPSSATYRTVLEALIARVEQGLIHHGAFLPTERELQAEFGVSRTTVRRALLALVEAGYGENVPNRGVVARRIERNHSKAIALIDGSTLVLRTIYRRLATILLKQGYHLVHIDSEALGLETAIHYALEKGCEGAFIWPFEGFPNSEFLRTVERQLPMVALDHGLRGFETDLITFDYFKMARQATLALANQGRTRIAVTGMLDMLETTHERFSGYMRGVFEAGLKPYSADYAFSVTSGQGFCDHRPLAERLAADDRPDAVFIMQDEFAIGAIETIRAAGLRVPHDVAVATIGDDVVLSVDGQPITAVHCDWNAFVDLAVEAMLHRIQNPRGQRIKCLAPHQLRNQEASSAEDSSFTEPSSSVGPNTFIAGSHRSRRSSLR